MYNGDMENDWDSQDLQPELVTVQFTDGAIEALDALFNLIHWDDLAKAYWRLLPDNLLDELTQEFRKSD